MIDIPWQFLAAASIMLALWLVDKVVLLLAKEQRHEILRASVADGTTASDAAAEFRNRSSSVMHIRSIDLDSTITAAGPAEGATVEISKAIAFQGNTNNSPFFSLVVPNEMNTDVALDSSSATFKAKRWGKGQLTLEPNESLFMNIVKTTGGLAVGRAIIEYEFS